MATVPADVWLKTRVFSDLSHVLAQNALHHCEGQVTNRFEAWAKKNDLRAPSSFHHLHNSKEMHNRQV